jgi:protoporphyrinogen oxidase
MSRSGRVAVVGAGPMGLAVAYQLAKDGFKPVVYEADDRVGGMTASFDFDGVEIERYYHFHCESDSAFIEILQEFNLSDKLNWVDSKMGYWYKGKVQPWGSAMGLLRFDGVGLLSKFRYGLHAYISIKRDNWQPLEKYNAATWIRNWVGEEAYSVLWEKLFRLKFYEHTDNLSAPWIWSRIRRAGRSKKLGYLSGGSKTLLHAMRDYIEQNGGEFRLRSPVDKIVMGDRKIKGVKSKGVFEEYEKVISTIPLPLAAKIAPDLPRGIHEKYRSKTNIGCVCVIAKLGKPITQNFWLNTNDDAMDIPGIIEYSNLNPEVGHIAYVPYYMPQANPKYSDSDEVFKEKVSKYLKTINPSLKDSDIKAIKIHRYHFSQPVCEPNFLDSLPDAKVPIKGLWIADTSHYYPEDRGISESIGYGRNLVKSMLSDR